MKTSMAVAQEKLCSRESRDRLFDRYIDRITVDAKLSRALVSFQANKDAPFHRWFRYKEAFSAAMVARLLRQYPAVDSQPAHLLDPFAGTGTALFAAVSQGWKATGIELLPAAAHAVRARMVAGRVDAAAFEEQMDRIADLDFDGRFGQYQFPHLRITQGCFPPETERALSVYMDNVDEIADPDLRYLFWFAALTVLEDVSFTRKDGQYLRWDVRSGRNPTSRFRKARILNFREAILIKLTVMLQDIRWREIWDEEDGVRVNEIKLIEGSCLDQLPHLPDAMVDLVMTSPPYANRYDYTRTYALELAFGGYGEDQVKELRQLLLSATVENRSKQQQLAESYDRWGQSSRYERAVQVFAGQDALHEVLDALEAAKARGELNNNNIPNLVRNYFFEMNLVIQELARVLRPGGRIVMVNDNVQYHGEEVPVDLILSSFAEAAGLEVEHIWVVPQRKGNSSQQMGAYGRNELRKGVYVWRK